MTWVFVILGGALGAPSRYLTDRAVQARHDSVFPWGTFVVNAAGSFVLGALTGAFGAAAGSGSGPGASAFALLGTGLCGALTTYSTFSYETLRLAERRLRFLASVNVAGSLLVGLGAVYLGLTLTRDLLG